jgi:hypothetical protein
MWVHTSLCERPGWELKDGEGGKQAVEKLLEVCQQIRMTDVDSPKVYLFIELYNNL